VPYESIASVEVKRGYFPGNRGWLRIVTKGGSTYKILSQPRGCSRRLEAARADLLNRVKHLR
jgi:hypothetical protein